MLFSRLSRLIPGATRANVLLLAIMGIAFAAMLTPSQVLAQCTQFGGTFECEFGAGATSVGGTGGLMVTW
jgi:hypothetical protein